MEYEPGLFQVLFFIYEGENIYIFVQQVTKIRFSLKLDLSVIYAVEILLKQFSGTTTEGLKIKKTNCFNKK